MDTPLAATVHKKNVHVGGGKTFTMRKPIKLKAAGKRRKAPADFRDTYAPSSGVSNDVDLKPMAHGKQQIAGADPFTTKKQIAVSLDNFEMGSKPLNHKLFDEWDSDDSEECDCSTLPISEDEVSMYNFFSASLYYDSHPSDYKCLKYDDKGTYSTMCSDKVYGIKDPDLHSPMSFPGPPCTDGITVHEEIFGPPRSVVLYKCPPLELKSEDDFGFGNDYRW